MTFNETIGLDISSEAITAVELDMTRKGLRVVNFGRILLEEGVVEDDCIVVNREAFRTALTQLLGNGYSGPFASRNVVIAIPEEKTFAHRLTVPSEKAEDPDEIMRLAKDYLPIELTEAIIDFKPLKKITDEKGMSAVNVVAVQKTLIDGLVETLESEGLKVVAVDMSRNAIIRSCQNHFQGGQDTTLVGIIDEGSSAFAVKTADEESVMARTDVGGKHLIEAAKRGLGMDTTDGLMSAIRSAEEADEATRRSFENHLSEAIRVPLGELRKKAEELKAASYAQSGANIRSVFIIGSYGNIPGISGMLKEVFEGCTVHSSFSYIDLDEKTTSLYPEAIGLALRAVLPPSETEDINLLPIAKKQKLIAETMTPKVFRWLMVTALLLGALLVFLGIQTVRGYLDLQLSRKELGISTEKATSPYLTTVAQTTAQQTQLENQIRKILKEAIPAEAIIRKLDGYNVDGIAMVNASYRLEKKSIGSIRVRAKTDSRESTERFIEDLEQDDAYKTVFSPLSNLVGKGERFINVDLTLDVPGYIEQVAEKQATPQKPTPKAPSPPEAAPTASYADELLPSDPEAQ